MCRMQWFHLQRPVQLTIGGILGVLVAATVWVAVVRRFHPARDWTELTQRTTTWWILAAVFIGALIISPAT